MTVVADQRETIAFLRAAFADAAGPPRLIATKTSLVFLGAGLACKLKRAVRVPFLDVSTPRRRLEFCSREFALNSRFAPELYLAVRRVTRAADAGLTFDGEGELVDAVVVMRRFADDERLDDRAQRGDSPTAMMTDLARALAARHADAAPSRAHGGAAAMARVLSIDEEALRASALFGAREVDTLVQDLRKAHARLSPLLDARRDAGKIRHCHGGLALSKICALDGGATSFDRLEFGERRAAVDVLDDLASMLMELWRRDRRDVANLVFNRYLDAADETDGLALTPFFIAVRAAARAHVAAAQAREAGSARAEELRVEALRSFDLARACLAPRRALLVAFGGLSGSGKSTAAAAIAPTLGPVPGARILSSDRIRKALHGVVAETRLPAAAYEPEMSRAVYETQRRAAAATLSTGVSVVADALFDRPESRAAIAQVARAAGAGFRGVWLDAPLDVLRSRVAARVGDASDATVEIVRLQAAADLGEIAWTRLDAAGGHAAVREQVFDVLVESDLIEDGVDAGRC